MQSGSGTGTNENTVATRGREDDVTVVHIRMIKHPALFMGSDDYRAFHLTVVKSDRNGTIIGLNSL
jgi:hypothetical protein